MSRSALRVGQAAGIHIALLCPSWAPLSAQVLLSGENGGKGSRSVMLGANAIQVDGFGVLSNNWLQYGSGISGRIDGFLAYGNIATAGRFQSYAALGSNIGLLRRPRAALDVALYNNATFALSHRRQACAVLLISAVIASKPVRMGGHTLTLYGGAMRQTPIGTAADAFFTPAAPVYAGVAGVSSPIRKNMALFVEYNPGGAQRSGGLGLLYTFPRATNRGDRVGGKDAAGRPPGELPQSGKR